MHTQTPAIKEEEKNNSKLEAENGLSMDKQFGHWRAEEKRRYLFFIEHNMAKFICKKKRAWKIYKGLSEFIPTRTAEQCRCHHRKLLIRFKTPQRILSALKKEHQRQQYQQEFSYHISNQLRRIKVSSIKKLPVSALIREEGDQASRLNDQAQRINGSNRVEEEHEPPRANPIQLQQNNFEVSNNITMNFSEPKNIEFNNIQGHQIIWGQISRNIEYQMSNWVNYPQWNYMHFIPRQWPY